MCIKEILISEKLFFVNKQLPLVFYFSILKESQYSLDIYISNLGHCQNFGRIAIKYAKMRNSLIGKD